MSSKRPSASQATQPTISSFFSQTPSTGASPRRAKRGNTPIDLTVDSDEGEQPPPHKRQKTTSTFFTPRKSVPSSPQSSTQPPRTGGHAEQWRFDPVSPSKAAPHADDEGQRRVHERAKKILLGSGDVFAHRSSSGAATPAPDGDGPAENDAERSADEGDEAEKKFGELMEMFSSSTPKAAAKKGKGAAKKAAAPPVAGPSRSRTQRVEEIGPSGQPYTPFELQVRICFALAIGFLFTFVRCGS